MLGHGQADTRSRSGQNRSYFKFGISGEKIVPIWFSFFYSEFIGAIFIPVGGLQPPQKRIQKIGVCFLNSVLD